MFRGVLPMSLGEEDAVPVGGWFFFDEFVLILRHFGIWKTFMMCSVDLLHPSKGIHFIYCHT